MRQYLKNEVFKASKWNELFLSVIILIAVVGGSIWLIGDLITLIVDKPGAQDIYAFVGEAFSLVICIEFIKMLCKHTPDTLVEVLMFAIARQMIVEHTSPIENLVGIIAIAILFAVKKFLFGKYDDVDKTIFLPWEKIASVNSVMHTQIPEEVPGQKLSDLFARDPQDPNSEWREGQCYFFIDGALRIDQVKKGRITQIEVIRRRDALAKPIRH